MLYTLEKEKRDAFIAAQENLKEVMREIIVENNLRKKVILEIDEFYIAPEGDMTYIDTHIENDKDLRECLSLYQKNLNQVFPSMTVLKGREDSREIFQNFHKSYKELLEVLVA